MRPRRRWTPLLPLLLLAAVFLPGATSAAGDGAAARAREPGGTPVVAAAPGRASAPGGARLLSHAPAEAPLIPSLPLDAFASAFDRADVVALYGVPGVPAMGALGRYAPRDAVREAARLAVQYDAVNGDRAAVPALHLIVAVAQDSPMPDGSYLLRLGREVIEPYVEATRDAGALLFLDVQIGWTDPLAEARRLEWALAEPHVHLALDPEFATRTLHAAPGQVIGTLGADDVNGVQRYLGGLVADRHLPRKTLVLHQFMDEMLTGTERYAAVPEVEIAIDMDGFGGQYAKLSKYDVYALARYAAHPALKLFFEWDTPLLTLAQLGALPHPPALVIYQ